MPLLSDNAMSEINDAVYTDLQDGVSYEQEGFYITRLSKALDILFNDELVAPQIHSECKAIGQQFLERHEKSLSREAAQLLVARVNESFLARQARIGQ